MDTQVLVGLLDAKNNLSSVMRSTNDEGIRSQLFKALANIEDSIRRFRDSLSAAAPLSGSNDARMQFEIDTRQKEELLDLRIQKQQLQIDRLDSWLADVVHHLHDMNPNVPCKCSCHYFRPEAFNKN